MNINAVTLTGNLTHDPELRQVGEYSVCELSIAVNGREKRNGEWTDRPDFFYVSVWGKLGENCARYLTKGRPVAISGRLRQERWEKDGERRSVVKIVADAVQFLGTHDGAQGQRNQPAAAQPQAAPAAAPAAVAMDGFAPSAPAPSPALDGFAQPSGSPAPSSAITGDDDIPF